MRCFIASDHAGYEMKEFAREFLKKLDVEVTDLGPTSKDRVDYPDYALALCSEINTHPGYFGVLICGTGIGMSMAANKCDGIRAALATDAYTAAMGRAHNDANVLCFGARVVGLGVAESIMSAWVAAKFEGGRHAQRVEKIDNIKG
ncbi:MAG: ribose 5-phosphate isomerase B [Campylobacterales bacterium]